MVDVLIRFVINRGNRNPSHRAGKFGKMVSHGVYSQLGSIRTVASSNTTNVQLLVSQLSEVKEWNVNVDLHPA